MLSLSGIKSFNAVLIFSILILSARKLVKNRNSFSFRAVNTKITSLAFLFLGVLLNAKTNLITKDGKTKCINYRCIYLKENI